MQIDGDSIGRRVTAGAFWTVAMRFSMRILGVVSIIILARILVPEDFGIVAKAAMIATFLEMVTAFGLDAALIQNRDATHEHYDTVWTIHVARALVISLVLLLVASPAATFLREPELDTILIFYALASAIRGFENVGVVDFRRDLQFDRDFKFGLIQKLAGFVVTISVALIWQNYWAFVVGVLVTSLTGTITSFWMSPFRPSFSVSEWRSLFHFSKYIFYIGIVHSIVMKIETFILSRFSTTGVVGTYTVADEIATTVSTEVAMPIARAAMPGLAKLNDDSSAFESVYTTSILVSMLLLVPASAGVGALAIPITDVLLGSKWSDAAPFIAILAFVGVARAISSISASAFLSSGRLSAYAKVVTSRLVLRLLFLVYGYVIGGPIGMAWGMLAAENVFLLVSLYVQHSIGFVNLGVLISQLWRVFAAAALMYLCLTRIWQQLDCCEVGIALIDLVVQVVLGALVYASVLMTLRYLSRDKQGPEEVVIAYFKEFWSDRNSRSSRDD